MKKKISLLLCVLVMALSFAGCSSKNKGVKYDEDSMIMYSNIIVGSFATFEEDSFSYYKEMTDFDLNHYLREDFKEQTGVAFPASGEDFVGIINSWQAAEAECGEFVSCEDFVVEDNTVSAVAEFKNRKATIIFTFSEDGTMMESMDVSAKFSMGEILTKAGLNTLLGMGTVFAVLIFLAFLISLMKYIPVLMDLFTKKKSVKEEVIDNSETAEESTETVDDLELIAVITAAIAAQEGTTTDGFVVRSIRRRPSNNW